MERVCRKLSSARILNGESLQGALEETEQRRDPEMENLQGAGPLDGKSLQEAEQCRDPEMERLRRKLSSAWILRWRDSAGR
ncbi:hypothetical protein NDU88_000710 [Pleurodeles waltl]|uniref:Uncharacterized protein n=1 Tax=Pleurodeles waltl TaxID=8319 RepID=A0AAV7SY27_PLEWA|nr:hypothetical protein NDU88_000710 [Pleurodeles waltl]